LRGVGEKAVVRGDTMGDGNAQIVWKNSIFRVDHNLNGHRRP
jgi:hypothetical protein